MNRSAQVGKYIYSTKAIGKGSFSKVYKGFNTDTDEISALKIIDKLSLKPELVTRLHDEIALLTQLKHPHIAQLKEFLEDEDNFYLVLEYCAGGDLAHRIKKGRIPEDVARKYMQQLTDVLRYLKSRNIIHRDLKPQNILLTSDQQTIKVTDFNFARELYDNDLAQTLCGSPLYMAPEIIENHEYTVKSDLWSVGMILYEMVYGNAPYFDAYNLVDLLQKINNRPIYYSNRVSSECNQLLNGLLQKDPIVRYSWNEYFTHSWLQTGEPVYIATEEDNIWESVSLSTIATPTRSSQPVRIEPHRFVVDIVDNYVPLGITPPKYAQSEPIDMYRVNSHRGSITSGTFQPGSNPESRTVADNIWSYMTSSVAVIKGAFDYISSIEK
uniref:Putative serine/threonine protein kinase n=1 Tax=Marseillevirus LCMAC201 TaxID=2506605 RepID=A0A481YVZ8_9VIRU|nr:MAG: putative serine/threonine protein kinase [Marseillevirus LCMAC201]